MPTHAALVTPERVLYEGEADYVVLRTEGGEIMFLANHAPFVGAVDITVVRIAPAGSESSPPSGPPDSAEQSDDVRAAVHGGYVHVADNRVLVLAGVAELAGEIDVERARRALDRAEASIEQGSEREGSTIVGTMGQTDEAVESTEPAGMGAGIEQSPTMLALVYPEEPVVAARRARVRLDAAGVLEDAGAHP
ncbi:MAG: FoF1 ATP synthase subunit delta/epsilon [Acidimicrobiales bacterium]